MDPSDALVHTQNIERLWRDLKEWTKQLGIKSEYFEQYFVRYIFLKENYQRHHHQFFLDAGTVYKPQSTRQCTLPGPAVPVEDTEFYDTRVEDDPQPGTSCSR